MLTLSHHRAVSPLACSDEWSAVQIVRFGGRSLYRAVRSARCKACRNAKQAVERRGLYTVAPSLGEHCGICGNPYVYATRSPKDYSRRLH